MVSSMLTLDSVGNKKSDMNLGARYEKEGVNVIKVHCVHIWNSQRINKNFILEISLILCKFY